MTPGVLPRSPTRQELAILRHPDQRTAWAIVLAAELEPGAPSADELRARLAEAHRSLPLIGARLQGETWRPGAAPGLVEASGDPLFLPGLGRRFDLAEEPPLRVALSRSGRRIALAGHHAAFDGLAMVALLGTLLGGPVPGHALAPPPGAVAGRLPAIKRLLRPADRVAPSLPRPAAESLAVRELRLSGRDLTARIAAACAAAAGERNLRCGRAWRRIGISVGMGGPPGFGNVASYRRVDLPGGEPVAPLVAAALADSAEPAELGGAPRAMRLLSPIAGRMSDSLLVSNLGRQALPAVRRLDFFPVARGRSAVAFGAAGLDGGPSTLSVRARDIAQDEVEALLDAAVARLAAQPADAASSIR
jgi:hypothetical protein